MADDKRVVMLAGERMERQATTLLAGFEVVNPSAYPPPEAFLAEGGPSVRAIATASRPASSAQRLTRTARLAGRVTRTPRDTEPPTPGGTPPVPPIASVQAVMRTVRCHCCASRAADASATPASAGRMYGGSFDEDVNVQHHDPRGGSPVVIARAYDRTSLARGAVLAGDAGGSFTKSLYTTTRAKKDRALEGGRR